MESSPSIKPTLQTLPYDVFHQIIVHIAEEDRNRVTQLEHPFKPETISPHPLLALSQTCKALRNVCLPSLFRVINISNRRGCQRLHKKIIDQLEDILKYDAVLENIKVLRFYYVGHPEYLGLVSKPERDMIEDESVLFPLILQLFQKIGGELHKLRLNIEPPNTDLKIKQLFEESGISFPKIRELKVGSCSDWMIRMCPSADVLTQVQYNGNLPQGFNGRSWEHRFEYVKNEQLLENIAAVGDRLKMLWVWGFFTGEGLDDLVAAAPRLNHIGFFSRWAEPYANLTKHLLPLAPTLEHITFFIIVVAPLTRDGLTIQLAKQFPKLKHVWYSSSYHVKILREQTIDTDGATAENFKLIWTNTENNQVEWRCGKYDELITRRY